MVDSSDKPASAPESSYVLAERDYADIVHLGNPSVIERILSATRAEGTAYIGELLRSGIPRFVLAGPKVAFTAMTIEALTDLSREMSAWRKDGRIPEDFSGRPAGHQTWVDLLREIDSNPVDAERLKALKAMFLAANQISATDGESIVAYQLFQIAKMLNSGELLLLKATYATHKAGSWPKGSASSQRAIDWRFFMAEKSGHGLSALVKQNETALANYGLISPVVMSGSLETIREDNARLTDLGIRFCQNLERYTLAATGQSPG
jgi:hypothetical protein